MLPRFKRRFGLDLRQLRDQIGPDSDIYMKRRQLFAIRLGRWIIQARINDIHRADRDPNPHTHPMSFLSWIIKGRYLEAEYSYSDTTCVTLVNWREQWSWAWRSKSCAHKIAMLGTPTVRTLFIAFLDADAPDYGQWGFMVRGEFVTKQDYLKANPNRQ